MILDNMLVGRDSREGLECFWKVGCVIGLLLSKGSLCFKMWRRFWSSERIKSSRSSRLERLDLDVCGELVELMLSPGYCSLIVCR